MAKSNPHRGSNFDYLRKEDGIYKAMQAGKLSKVAMAQRMATSRSQPGRALDPTNLSIQLDTLIRAANAAGKTVKIKFRRQSNRKPCRFHAYKALN